MLRMTGILAFAGGFVLISPELRQMAADAALKITAYLNAHSPFSYVGTAAVVLGVMALFARGVSSPR